MKIIFLDIDGVLNTEAFSVAFWEFCKIQNIARPQAKSDANIIMRDEFGIRFDPMALRALKLIIEKTEAKIVISSTWRLSGCEVMKLMWEMRDLPGEVIDITPSFNTIAGTCRGDEIADWIKGNDVSSYVIIDDDSDMLPEQLNNFVQTQHEYGLTFNDAEKAISILLSGPKV